MTWLTWRQYRIEALIGLLVLVGLCIVFVIDGFATHATYQSMGLASCAAHPCDYQIGYAFEARTRGLASIIANFFQPWLYLIIGVFIGAPLLAREREQRTHYLVWTQSITRSRWLAIRLGLIATALLLAFVLLTTITTWWGEPLSTVEGPWLQYAIRGPVFPASIVFALLVGVAVGAFVRRTVPAMALTFVLLFAFFVLLGGMHLYLIPPLSKVSSIQPGRNEDGNWGRPGDISLYAGYADQAGNETGEISKYCGFNRTLADPDYAALANKCIREHNLQWKLVYQPPARFWPLQWVESSVLLLLALLLIPLIFWQLKKRIQ